MTPVEDRCINCDPGCYLPTYWSHVQEFRDRCVQCSCRHYEATEELKVSIDE